jgi:hypothetical protein
MLKTFWQNVANANCPDPERGLLISFSIAQGSSRGREGERGRGRSDSDFKTFYSTGHLLLANCHPDKKDGQQCQHYRSARQLQRALDGQ